MPTCSAVSSGQARHTAAAKAAANTRRPTSGVGGERNNGLSSQADVEAIDASSSASSASNASQT